MKKRMETLANEMLDGQILLTEALHEFEKTFIEQALLRNNQHISNTAQMLGIHRNTIAKKIASYNGRGTSSPGSAIRPEKK